VEYGIARFIGQGDKVIVEEPMALVSIVRHFASQGLTLEQDIRARMNSAQGLAFEEAVLLSCTKIFRRGARLEDVFQFHGPKPAWASQVARIVIPKDGNTLEVFDVINLEPVIPSTGVACFAEYPKDVQQWITSMSSGWCIPGKYMGPDLMTWLKLADGHMLLLLIQAKCRLDGNIDSLAADVAAKAIRSLTPSHFYAALVCSCSTKCMSTEMYS
jgi:hypothetical protein